MPSPIPLLCTCGLPYAHVKDGVLTVVARHHGEKHTCTIAVTTLTTLVDIQAASGKGLIYAGKPSDEEWKRLTTEDCQLDVSLNPNK